MERVYCSKKCYLDDPERKIKQRAYYENTPLDVLQQRWDNIGAAKKVRLSPEELDRIEEVMYLGYVKDKKMILKTANVIGKSYKALNNHINENPEWLNKFNPYPYQLTHKIQSLSPDEFRKLLDDLSKHSYEEIKNMWGVGLKTSKSLRDFYKIKKSFIFKGRETYPEKVVKEILLSLDIDHIKEKYVNDGRYRVDFMIDDKVIEVQGDFWHANPEIYDRNKELSYIQVKNIKNDKEKLYWLENNGFKVLYLWENELKTDVEQCYLKIKNFIYG